MTNISSKKKYKEKELQPLHDCPALGKNAKVARAWKDGKSYYLCPFCSYFGGEYK
jgi:hypothetical protein